MIDQFGRKKCQKKRQDVDYELLRDFFQKYFVVQKQWYHWYVKDTFSTYICTKGIYSCGVNSNSD